MSDCNLYRLMFGKNYIEKQYSHLADIHAIPPENFKNIIQKRIDELKSQQHKKYMSAIRCIAIIHGVDDNTMIDVIKYCKEQKCTDEIVYI